MGLWSELRVRDNLPLHQWTYVLGAEGYVRCRRSLTYPLRSSGRRVRVVEYHHLLELIKQMRPSSIFGLVVIPGPIMGVEIFQD